MVPPLLDLCRNKILRSERVSYRDVLDRVPQSVFHDKFLREAEALDAAAATWLIRNASGIDVIPGVTRVCFGADGDNMPVVIAMFRQASSFRFVKSNTVFLRECTFENLEKLSFECAVDIPDLVPLQLPRLCSLTILNIPTLFIGDSERLCRVFMQCAKFQTLERLIIVSPTHCICFDEVARSLSEVPWCPRLTKMKLICRLSEVLAAWLLEQNADSLRSVDFVTDVFSVSHAFPALETLKCTVNNHFDSIVSTREEIQELIPNLRRMHLRISCIQDTSRLGCWHELMRAAISRFSHLRRLTFGLKFFTLLMPPGADVAGFATCVRDASEDVRCRITEIFSQSFFYDPAWFPALKSLVVVGSVDRAFQHDRLRNIRAGAIPQETREALRRGCPRLIKTMLHSFE